MMTRRDTLKAGAAGMLALLSDWAIPAAADDETDVPFTDIPENFHPGNNPNSATRVFDIRKIDGPYVSKEEFFALQHMAQPEIDGASYRLKLTGMVGKAAEFSLDDLKKMHPV